MQTLFFGLALIAVTLLVIWMVRNDRLKPGEPMTGLFAMRKPLAMPKPRSPEDPHPGSDRRRSAQPGDRRATLRNNDRS